MLPLLFIYLYSQDTLLSRVVAVAVLPDSWYFAAMGTFRKPHNPSRVDRRATGYIAKSGTPGPEGAGSPVQDYECTP